VSGKQSKKERKALREAERARLRKQERQRTIFTIIVIAVVVAIGGALIWISLENPGDELADLVEDLPTEASPEPAAESVPEPAVVEETPVEEQPVACGAQEPEGAGTEKPTYDAPEQVLEEGGDYQAVVETSCGTVVIDLDQERAPETVNSFVFLAQEGFFDGQRIFRNATTIDALQTGSGTDDATYQHGYTIPGELEAAEADGYPPGSVAMANSGDPDSGGSQFFFVYGDAFQQGVDAGQLTPTYTRFGMVTAGLDVLEQIGQIPVSGPAGETPQERIYIESVTITTSRAEGPADDTGTETDAPAEATEQPTEQPTEQATE
jgi:peptidyl-prolyl cis-trans isomerase B (cyclophilin B)